MSDIEELLQKQLGFSCIHSCIQKAKSWGLVTEFLDLHPRFQSMCDELAALRAENAELKRLLWTPENENFCAGVIREAGHQVDWFGDEHDKGKEPSDWFWLIGYLTGKALKAAIDGNKEKALHHCISTAAVCANWHARISGTELTFRPGTKQKDSTNEDDNARISH